MFFLQKFKKSQDQEEYDNTTTPAPPDGVRLEYTSFGQGMPSYLAPNALLPRTSTSKKEEEEQQQQSKSTLGCFSTTNTISYQVPSQSETVPYPPRVSQEAKYSQDNSSTGYQQQQQNHQAAMKQMRGKPNFMKKTQHQKVNAKDPKITNNIQKEVDLKSDNQTFSDMSGKVMSSSYYNNSNRDLQTSSKGVRQSGRFQVLDPHALLTESDLNFPEMYRITLKYFILDSSLPSKQQASLTLLFYCPETPLFDLTSFALWFLRDYPKKIVNDVVGIGGIRLKQTKDQLQSFLEDSQSMAPCILGSLLINKLLAKEEQPNIVRYVQTNQTNKNLFNLRFYAIFTDSLLQFYQRSLFACEILAKSRTDCRAFFKRNQVYLQQSQSICTDDSKYIMLSNQLLASLNNPSVQLEAEIETDIDFAGGIDLSKFSKNRERQDQITTAKMVTQTTNLLDLISEENRDDSRINNNRNGFTDTTDNDDDIFESNPKANCNQKALFKNLHKKQYQQQKQPEGNSINVIDMLNEEDIKQQQEHQPLEQLKDIFGNMQINEAADGNDKQQEAKFFGKFKKNKMAQSNQLQLSSKNKDIPDLLDDDHSQQQLQEYLPQYQQHKSTMQKHPSHIQIHSNQYLTQTQQMSHSQYIQYVQQQPEYQYGFQGGYPVVYPHLQPYLPISHTASAARIKVYSQQPQVQQNQYKTITMDFTAQHLEQDDKEKKHSVDDLLNHALIDKDNFQIHRESPVNKSKEKTINEETFDFITL